MNDLYRELKRRKVFRVAATYAVVAWLVAQIVSVLDAPLSLPDWFDTVVIVLLAAGFPIALTFAWIFDLTTEGIERTRNADGTSPAGLSSGRIFDFVIIAALAVALGVTLWNRGIGDGAPDTAAATAIASPSIAVLPFADLSPGGDQAYFSDGIAEELLNELARLEGLSVAARTSSFSFKGSGENTRAIAERLGVSTILEGSVRRAGDELRINVQLIDAATGFHLLSASYDRHLDDIFAIQEDIARSVADALSVTLGLGDREALSTGTESRPAYEAYLRGRYALAARTPASIRRGFESMREAIELDPEYAQALAGLADAYIVLGSYNLLPLDESHPLARDAAERAIGIDPTLAEAYTSLAAANADYFWDWDEAGAQFERALELNPSYAVAHQWYAEYLQRLGRLDEGIEQARRAVELDPLSPLMHSALATAYYRARRHDEAIAQALATVEMEPDFVVARIPLGLAYAQTGRYDEARAAFATFAPGDPDFMSLLGYVEGLAGNRAEAEAALHALDGMGNASAILSAFVHAGLGNADEAFMWLDRAYENRDWLLGLIGIDPIWDALREDPRFDALVERVGVD